MEPRVPKPASRDGLSDEGVCRRANCPSPCASRPNTRQASRLPYDDRLSQTVVAIGGGGFLYGDRFRTLDDYVLERTGSDNPRICFLPTPCGDHPEFIEKFYAAFEGAGRLSHATLFLKRGTEARPQRHLLEQDLIYVSNGNLVSAMAIWHAHGIDRVLGEAWMNGTVMAGVSAGGVCWFEQVITDAGTETPSVVAGLGFVPGIIAAHTNVLPERERALRAELSERAGQAVGYALEDGVALHFEVGRLVRAIPCQEDRHALRLQSIGNGRVTEEDLLSLSESREA